MVSSTAARAAPELGLEALPAPACGAVRVVGVWGSRSNNVGGLLFFSRQVVGLPVVDPPRPGYRCVLYVSSSGDHYGMVHEAMWSLDRMGPVEHVRLQEVIGRNSALCRHHETWVRLDFRGVGSSGNVDFDWRARRFAYHRFPLPGSPEKHVLLDCQCRLIGKKVTNAPPLFWHYYKFGSSRRGWWSLFSLVWAYLFLSI